MKKTKLSRWKKALNKKFDEGFNLGKETVIEALNNYPFDFSRCTDSTQICEAIIKELHEAIEYIR